MSNATNSGGVVVRRWGKSGRRGGRGAAANERREPAAAPAAAPAEVASGWHAPLDREWVDIARPWLRGLGGLLLVGLSSNAVIRGTAEFLRPLLVDDLGKAQLLSWLWFAIPVGLLWGMLAAIVVFVGQVICGEISLIGYLFFFVPDVAALVWWQLPGWTALIARGSPATQSIVVVAALISVALAVVTAHYGEVLLFGPRRRALLSWLWTFFARMRRSRRRHRQPA